MRFYVKCKEYGHIEKVYVRFAQEPNVRSDIPFWSFQMKCSQGHIHTYYRYEVIAEVGLAPIGAAILGGLLFLVDPLLGIIGAGAGLFGVAANEEERVRRFNESPG